MKTLVDTNYVRTILQKILSIPSPSGFTNDAMEAVSAEARRLGYSYEISPKGGVVITVQGVSQAKVIGLSAHIDTLGAMVRSIKDNGKLRLSPIGGFMMQSIENEYCTIHTRDGRKYTGTILTTSPSVHVYTDARNIKREEAIMEVRIDELVESKADVLALGIATGDFISFDPRMQMLDNGFVKSRHLDDKAGVAALFGLLELLQRESLVPQYTLKLIISNYEEVGHGAAYIPSDISEFIAVDMGAIGEDLNCTERDVSICAKDSSGPYDYGMTTQLIELAKQNNISYAVDIYPHYSSDASAALRGGSNIRAALIGPGVHSSHGMERTHIDAIVGTSALLAAYVEAAHVK